MKGMLTCVPYERELGLVCSCFPGGRGVLALVLLKDMVANRRSKKEVCLWVSLASRGSGVTCADLAAATQEDHSVRRLEYALLF